MAYITVTTTDWADTFKIALNSFNEVVGYEEMTIFYNQISSVDLTFENKAVVINRKDEFSIFITCENDASYQLIDDVEVAVYPIIASIDNDTFSNNSDLKDYILDLIRV